MGPPANASTHLEYTIFAYKSRVVGIQRYTSVQQVSKRDKRTYKVRQSVRGACESAGDRIRGRALGRGLVVLPNKPAPYRL